MRKPKHNVKSLFGWVYAAFWALVIVLLLIGASYITFQQHFDEKIYPNVSIDGVSFTGQTRAQVEAYWLKKNNPFTNLTLTLIYDGGIATLSAQDLSIGYDATMAATQAYDIGRSANTLSNLFTIFSGQPIYLTPYFRWNGAAVDEKLSIIQEDVNIPAKDALFTFSNGRVTAFRPSENGQALNLKEAKQRIHDAIFNDARNGKTNIVVHLPVVTVTPAIATDQVNTFGIKELIGSGYSEFAGSIAGRIHNVALAASRLNGVLIKPGESFSFNDTVGDISAATGYQSAYIIKDGRTVLGDGGGVCQVSTTLFRAALDSGLPITERHAHAYRVHYYEEDGSKPGLDATVYNPGYDLKFVNDTPGYILIQTKTDLRNLTLTFDFYGTRDGRISTITNQKLWDVTPPPPALYQDDPTLPQGTEKQVDFAAWGAKASFDYKVTRGVEILENKTIYSTFRPWQAVYLRGTL